MKRRMFFIAAIQRDVSFIHLHLCQRDAVRQTECDGFFICKCYAVPDILAAISAEKYDGGFGTAKGDYAGSAADLLAGAGRSDDRKL